MNSKKGQGPRREPGLSQFGARSKERAQGGSVLAGTVCSSLQGERSPQPSPWPSEGGL